MAKTLHNDRDTYDALAGEFNGVLEEMQTQECGAHGF